MKDHSLERLGCQIHSAELKHPNADGAASLITAVEEQERLALYHWDGIKRGPQWKRPIVLFQYTLSGWGCLEQGGRTARIEPGMFFLVRIPSEHRYWLPAESEGWRFVWLITDHSFVVERLSVLVRRAGSVFPLAAASPAMALFENLLGKMRTSACLDPYAIESDLLRWMIELERHLDEFLYPPGRREQLLAEVRRHVTREIHRPVGVSELAEHSKMSRSHFSHYFKSITGLAPSEYILQLRLDAVLGLLRQGNTTLKEIAAATGFSDANHLCKCFRKKFHLSPGKYRLRIAPWGSSGLDP